MDRGYLLRYPNCCGGVFESVFRLLKDVLLKDVNFTETYLGGLSNEAF